MDATHNTVYLETTIPSFYYTLRTDPESVARMHWTRQWWAAYADACQLTTSAAVIDELGKGIGERTEERIALLANAVLLPITEEVIRIAQVYIDRRVMPRDPEGDALHLALRVVPQGRFSAHVELQASGQREQVPPHPHGEF